MASQADSLPRTFGRYVLFDVIGSGGMADIYLAKMGTSLGGHRLCVIKEIRASFDEDPAFVELLSAEARLAARLSHANIVQVFDLGREDGRLFLAMEYVEGFDLHQLLKRLSQRRIALPAEFAFSIVIDTLRGLDYAHRKRDDEGRPLGLVHRDVSPSNVLISFEGEVKLCDFGIARAAEAPADETAIARTRVAGKAGYMAPEHARGEDMDARADIFAAGILLWELCAGRRLYRAKDGDVLEQARAAKIPDLPDRGIPNHALLQAIVDRALAVDPAERFPTAAAFGDALEDFAIGQKLRASPLRFGAFMSDHFEKEIVDVRRERERAAERVTEDATEFGPASSPPPATAAPIEAPSNAIPIPAVPKEASPFEADTDEVSNDAPTIKANAVDAALLAEMAPKRPAAPALPSDIPPPGIPSKVSNTTFYTGLAIASVVLAGVAFAIMRAVM